ncbi:MAG: hypothetical protein H7Z37_13005 [Pyrinomonadaceae bacterium]|nr:hypothetical protein [Pyrinomonadaceae bacterium]
MRILKKSCLIFIILAVSSVCASAQQDGGTPNKDRKPLIRVNKNKNPNDGQNDPNKDNQPPKPTPTPKPNRRIIMKRLM